MFRCLLFINFLIYDFTIAVGFKSSRGKYSLGQSNDTEDVALPVLNVYYENFPTDWKLESQNKAKFTSFEQEIDRADDAMRNHMISLLDIIAKEKDIISKMKYKVMKKQLSAKK